MKINIAASHRFHLMDLARELQNLGFDVKFYSYVPKERAASFGLNKNNVVSLFWLVAPLFVFRKITKNSDLSLKLINWALDYYMVLFMRPCDVYIALGTVYEESFTAAKNKFNAKTILEWGSKHIDEQLRILEQIPGIKKQDPYFSKRAKRSYKIVDYISVASDHVRLSFEERGIESRKILQNPYGVDVSMFGPTILDKKDVYDIIMVGGWSYRKGCDLLVEACRKGGWSLLHVGSLVDFQFPEDGNMKHINSVDQKNLIRYYSKARIFVLPSREEGLAMVQPQAVACGLPVVCSKNTGGRDLKNFIADKKWIIETKTDSVDDLCSSISMAMDLAIKQDGLRDYCGDIDKNLSWGQYGVRYKNNLVKILEM